MRILAFPLEAFVATVSHRSVFNECVWDSTAQCSTASALASVACECPCRGAKQTGRRFPSIAAEPVVRQPAAPAMSLPFHGANLSTDVCASQARYAEIASTAAPRNHPVRAPAAGSVGTFPLNFRSGLTTTRQAAPPDDKPARGSIKNAAIQPCSLCVCV